MYKKCVNKENITNKDSKNNKCNLKNNTVIIESDMNFEEDSTDNSYEYKENNKNKDSKNNKCNQKK